MAGPAPGVPIGWLQWVASDRCSRAVPKVFLMP